MHNLEGAQTPYVAKLSRKDNHIVRVTMDGYALAELTLTKSMSGWVWGNIVLGGLIGLAVDAITGGLFNLNPAQLQASLANGTLMKNSADVRLAVDTVALCNQLPHVRPLSSRNRTVHDFSKARANPYAKSLKRSITIRLGESTIAYFKDLAAELDMPYQSLINLYLQDCAARRRRPNMRWLVPRP